MTLIFSEKAKQMGSTAFTPLPKWESFRVNNCLVLYEPGVYQGEGTENRVNICVKSDEVISKILEFAKMFVRVHMLMCQGGGGAATCKGQTYLGQG